MAKDKKDKKSDAVPPEEKKTKKKSGSKIRQKTEKLFEDLSTLASEETPETSQKKGRKKTSREKVAPAKDQGMELQLEVARLRARIKELEENQNHKTSARTSSNIYEREQLSYAYEADAIKSVNPSDFRLNTKNPLQAPLTSTGSRIGKFIVDAPEDKKWTTDEEELLKSVAQQASLQIQSLRLLSSAERARQEAEEATRQFMHENWQNYLDAINESEKIGYAYDQASVTPFLDDAEPDTYQATVKVMDEQIGKIAVKPSLKKRFDENEKKMIASVAEQIAQQVENIRLLADAARARAAAEDATRRLTQESWQEFTQRRTEKDSNTLSYIYDNIRVSPLKDNTLPHNVTFAVPIEVRGAKIGELAIAGEKEIDPKALDLASEVAARTSLHIESLRLLEETERGRQQLNKRAAELETVAKVSTASAAIQDPDALLRAVVDLTNFSFSLYHTSVHLYKEDENGKKYLELAAASGKKGYKMLEKGLQIPYNKKQSLVATAARSQEVQICNDALESDNFLNHPLLPDVRSEMAIPMVVADQLIGIFDVQSDAPDRFTEEDKRTYNTLASQTAIALQNALLYQEQIVTVERLRELDHLKTSFLANMSHELRTPLNSISGFTQVILEGLDGPLTPEMQDDLGLIDKNANHLLNLINEILDMAKIEAGRLSVSVEPNNLHQIIEDVVRSTAGLAQENALTMTLENRLTPDQFIMIDGMRIQQVMINLIGNSMKFTKEGGINILAEQDDERVRISVKDTGMGIPPDKLESIFEAFSQVDTSTTRKVGGTGLGLPISRRFVEMHNGRLWAESTGIYGQGSTFILELPVVLPPDEGQE